MLCWASCRYLLIQSSGQPFKVDNDIPIFSEDTARQSRLSNLSRTYMKMYLRWWDRSQRDHRGHFVCPEPQEKQWECKGENRCGPSKEVEWINLVIDWLGSRKVLNLRSMHRSTSAQFSFLSIALVHHFFSALFFKVDWSKFKTTKCLDGMLGLISTLIYFLVR